MFRQGPDFLLRDKRLLELSEFEITRVNCILQQKKCCIKFTFLCSLEMLHYNFASVILCLIDTEGLDWT